MKENEKEAVMTVIMYQICSTVLRPSQGPKSFQGIMKVLKSLRIGRGGREIGRERGEERKGQSDKQID